MLQSALADDFDAVLAALDLVFRWIVLRLSEGNMQVHFWSSGILALCRP